MKKVLFLIIIFTGSFFIFNKINASERIAKYRPAVTAPSPTPKPIPIGLPQTISIPAINIQASVESVGMDAQGRMGVPTNNVDTAWYKYGYRPGQKGSAVIDGHYDTPTGAPAVFYNLSKLQRGDSITVTDSNGRTYTFVVTDVVSYPSDQLPMQQIFASADATRLNLITCDGTWNRTEHNYSNRAVIYSVLQQ